MPDTETELEINFPANVKLHKDSDTETWTAIITRKIEAKSFPVTVLKNLSANDCFLRLGVKVPEKEVPVLEGLAGAKQVLSDALQQVTNRTIIETSEVTDIFLDAMNKLGWAESKEEPNDT